MPRPRKRPRPSFFPRDAFIDLIKRDPSLALNMLATLSWRLHKFSGLIEDLSLKEVPSRLAAHLLYLSERQARLLPIFNWKLPKGSWPPCSERFPKPSPAS